MDDDLLAGDIEGSSDFEDALDESEESNNTDSDQSLGLRQYWQGWRTKEDSEVKMKNVVELPIKEVPKLMELSARIAARSFSFDQLEYYYKQALIRKERIEFENSIKINGFATMSTPNIYDSKDRRAITEAYFLPIIKHSFPEDDSNIRFYSCVANGCAVAFKNGEQSFASNNVFNVVQIGYLITAKVKTTSDEKIGNKYLYMPCESKVSDSTDIHHVTICVDRQKIISTSCTCQQSKWCQHVIAACLERLHRPERVQFRTTIWDSITELKRRQVQKLVQYFINALPRQYLPVAQQLIDELKDKDSEINKIAGAPDPTDGGHDDIPIWNFSVEDTHKAISQILIKFVKPSPVVHCDISMLNNEPQPAVANEYNIRRMVLKSRHPIPLWNGFELVCEMFRRKDENATMMLHMITTHCLSVDQIVIWWYQAKLLESGQWHMQLNPMKNNRSLQQNSFIKLLYDASELCDEVVRLWKIAALNPKLTDYEREQLTNLLQLYHQTAVSKILKALNKPDSQYQMKVMINSKGQYLSPKTATFQKLFFPGFSAALEACQINYQRAELRSFPLSVVKCMPSSTLNDCLNIPLLKTVQNNFIFELEQTSHQVTTAVFFEDQIESSAEGTSNQKSRSKKKRRKRVRMHNQSTSQNQIAKQNPGSNVNFGGEYSGGEDSLGDDFDDACYVTKEKHQLELDEFFAQMHAEREPFQIRLDACDAIAHHGYLAESIYMAMKLADELLKNKPNINYEGDAYCNHLIECTSVMEEGTSQVSVTKKTTGPMFSGVLLVRQIDSCPKKVEVQLPAPEPLKATKLAVETMESALKIMKILLSCPNSKFEFNNKIITQEETNRLLIEIGVAALSMPRKPAATHQLEVYLNYLDTEILDLLRKVKLLAKHLHHLATVASHLITQCQQPNTPTMPPLMLALFLIESLSKSKNQTKNSDISRTQEQENIALQAALLCLDMKPSYVEEDLPMNFECYRQLKRILTVSLLSQYKDNVFVLGLILDKLLDPGVHRIHENHESNGAYFLEKIPEYKQQYIEGKRPVFKSGNVDLKVNSAGIQSETENEFQTKDLMTNASEPSTSTCGQRKTTKVVSPHATEALALFYYDLATKIYTEAGGPSPSHVFINTAGGFGRPNRNLQMCAFLIGFYAIGVHNLTVRNWSNRAPYVKLVGWLQNQAIEIGQSALEFVEKNWMHHFTAVEVSALADKANHRADQEVITQGAKLALTALKSANFLPANDAENRIRQCKDWGLTLLEQACIAVERVANEKGNIQPQVLFTVSRSWYEIYMEECSREEIIIPPPNLPPRNNQMQYGYFPLRPMNEQCHNPCMMPMYFPPPPISHYVNGPAAGLHPSYSAPNLLPPPQIPYQFRNDYNYYFNHVVQQRPSGPFQNNLPVQNMRKPRPLIALNMQSNNHSQFPSRNYNVSQTWHSPPQSASPYPPVSIGDSRKMRLLHAYRTGMLAMQVQRNQELEDKKLFEKHLCSPPYIEDLARLRKICQQLGYPYLQSFFEHVAACISAPKLLEEYAKAAMEYFAMTHHIHQPIVAYIEQLPLPPPGQLVIIPPKQNLSGVPSSSANCGSTSTAKMLPHQYANIHIDVGKTADSITVQMHNVGYPEYIVELVRRGVEMSYVAISCQITFGKLTEADAEALRMYLKSARCIFQFIPEGKGLYEIFIRYWKNQKLSKKKISELRIKDLFEEFIDFHVFENHN